jgi:hypothetical protein
MKPASPVPDYSRFLTEVKGRIQSARLQAGRAVNRELVMLYWDIGRGIVEKQKTAGWGESVVERLAADLRAEFPDLRGFSGRTLRDTKRFYLAYSDESLWPQVVAKLRSGMASEFLQQLVAEISHAYSSSIPIQTGWRMSHSFAAFSGPTFLAQAARELAPAAAVRFNSTGARAP